MNIKGTNTNGYSPGNSKTSKGLDPEVKIAVKRLAEIAVSIYLKNFKKNKEI